MLLPAKKTDRGGGRRGKRDRPQIRTDLPRYKRSRQAGRQAGSKSRHQMPWVIVKFQLRFAWHIAEGKGQGEGESNRRGSVEQGQHWQVLVKLKLKAKRFKRAPSRSRHILFTKSIKPNKIRVVHPRPPPPSLSLSTSPATGRQTEVRNFRTDSKQHSWPQSDEHWWSVAHKQQQQQQQLERPQTDRIWGLDCLVIFCGCLCGRVTFCGSQQNGKSNGDLQLSLSAYRCAHTHTHTSTPKPRVVLELRSNSSCGTVSRAFFCSLQISQLIWVTLFMPFYGTKL